MRNGDIASAIREFTAINSNYETKRNYISMSHIHSDVNEIINQFRNGFEDTTDIRLKCYKGYQMEEDLMKRIKAIFGTRIKTGTEISVYNGLVKGHPDFEIDNYPGDCKSVLKDDWIPDTALLPRRIYWQMQAYMKYSQKDKALVIFESRESGKLVDYWIRENKNIQSEIENKIKQILNILK